MLQSRSNLSRFPSVMHGPGRLHSWMTKSGCAPGPCEQPVSYQSTAGAAEVGPVQHLRAAGDDHEPAPQWQKVTVSHMSGKETCARHLLISR